VALKLAGIDTSDPRIAQLRGAFWRWAASRRQQLRQDQPQLVRPLSAAILPEHSAEIVLLPFHLLYQMSAWTRAIAVSLSIVHAANRGGRAGGFQLDELWVEASPGLSSNRAPLSCTTRFSPSMFPEVVDGGSKAIRQKAIARRRNG